MKNESEFKKELEQLINKYSTENSSDTPDFIIADYLVSCLDAFNTTVRHREKGYGRKNPTFHHPLQDPDIALEIGTEAGWVNDLQNQ